MYGELSRDVQGVTNVDLTRFTIELRTLVDTGVRLRPIRPKIKDDGDVEILLCDGGHIPEVSKTPVSQTWIPGASNYSFKLVRTNESSSCNRLSKCGMFESKKGLKRPLLSYALKENFEIGVTRLFTDRYEVGCKDPKFSGRSLKPKEITTNMQVEYGLDADTKFEYLFIAFSASLVGFQTATRPAICIDVTHLKGRFGGVMFIAACKDANNQVFPLAYCWVDVECEDSWTWFIKELKKAIGCTANCIIISDSSLAIKITMAKEYLEIPYGICGFHININLKNRFKCHIVCNLLHEASRAHRQSEFLEKIRELSRVNIQAYEYLMRVMPHRWSRAYCPVRLYEGMTSNIMECMNNCLWHARQLSLTMLVEYIRDMIQKWFHERCDVASINTTQLSWWANGKLTTKKEEKIT
ncbi:hypothetical protein Ddye_000020 [Dipteronia dyeriana]|uniref:MULE transposase domain-containing protein n=1 Tax=Dipteronia dyeriana TaxID=168575 RepID=A0AAD9XLG8_9ROSI|nr:hypothetical protein Ddye_000020 [Dipteronia dyeriana]